MYPVIIQIHQVLSWAILATALFTLFRAYTGIFFRKQWSATDRNAAILFTMVADLQLVAGVVLYAGLSPVTRQAFGNFSAAMADPLIRYYAVEHILLMVLAVILIHLGRSKARNAQFTARKHRISAFFYTLAMVLILLRIPWERIFII